MKKLIGITGPICSGKSTACNFFEKKYSLNVLRTDEIVKSLYRPGKAGWKKLRAFLPAEFFYKNHLINKKKLAKKFFSDQKFKSGIEKAIHPLVIEEIVKKSRNRLTLVESAIFPPELLKMLDVIIEIKCDFQTASERNRKYSEELFKKIWHTYKSPKKVNHTIDNSQNHKNFCSALESLISIPKLASGKALAAGLPAGRQGSRRAPACPV